jgi:hypothetical protein
VQAVVNNAAIVLSNTSNIAQWTELGQQLTGDEADSRRRQVLETLENLEIQVQADLRNPSTSEPMKLEALAKALETAKEIAQTVLKPVDLSAL